MISKTLQIAELSAMLAKHKPELSTECCAKLAQQLHSISAAVVSIFTFECNGYKTEHQDAHLNKLSRTNQSTANAYRQKIQDEGASHCEKRKAQLNRKLQKICSGYGLYVESAGLSGLKLKIDEHRECYI